MDPIRFYSFGDWADIQHQRRFGGFGLHQLRESERRLQDFHNRHLDSFFDDDFSDIFNQFRAFNPPRFQSNTRRFSPSPRHEEVKSNSRDTLERIENESDDDEDEELELNGSESQSIRPISPNLEHSRASSPYTELIKNKERLLERFRLFGVREKRSIDGDGNCQFAAISDQLFNNPKLHLEIRRIIVYWLRRNQNYEVEKGVRLIDFLETECFGSWEGYCDYMSKEQVWGDHMTLIAATEVFKCTILILSSVQTGASSDPITVIEPKKASSDRVILLSHLHELHYGSLTQDGLDQSPTL